MKIFITGLDNDYKDCVVEMGGKILEEEDSLNVMLPHTVDMFTDGNNVNFTSPTVGMVVSRFEFVRIEIL